MSKTIQIKLSRKSWEEFQDLREKIGTNKLEEIETGKKYKRKTYEEYLEEQKKNPIVGTLF